MPNSTRNWIVFALFVTAWLAIWGFWLPGRSASLNQNAIDLAEWSTFLIDVRSGDIRIMPDILRLALILTVIGVGLSAAVIEPFWQRWLVRLAALLPAVVMLPPYPFILQAFFSDSYGLRFTVCAFGFAGIAAMFFLDQTKPYTRSWFILGVAASALGLASWAYMQLRRPFTVHLGNNFSPGWGSILFAASLIAVLVVQTLIMLNQKEVSTAPGELQTS